MPAVLLRVAMYAEPDHSWCAHALECDAMAIAASADTALDALTKLLYAQMVHDQRHRRAPFSTYGVAPRRIWEAFAAATATREPIVVNRGDSGSLLRIMVASVPGAGGANVN
jgi:hypothetical protein